MRKLLIVILLIVSLAFVADQATVFYIDPAGSDETGDGSAGNPWKSLAYACSQTYSGDDIHVNEGIYNETAQSIWKAGVDIVGEGADLSEIYFNNTSTSGCINGSSSVLTNGNQSISYVKLNGNNLTARLSINASLRSNVEVHNCTIVNFLGGAVRLWGITYAGSTNRATGNKIYNCTITNCADRAYGAMIVLVGQDGTEIYNNILDQRQRAANHNGNIIDAVGYTSESLGDLRGSMNVGVQYHDNKSYKPDTDGVVVSPLGWNFHLEFWTTKGGIHVWNNEFHGGMAIDIGGTINTKGTYAYAWFVHDNLFAIENKIAYADGVHAPGGVDIEGSSSDVIVTRNHFKNLAVGVPFNISQPNRVQSRIYVNYNLFENIGYTNNGWGWSIPIGGNNSPTAIYEDIYLENNVVTGSSRAHFMMSSLGIIRRIYIRNNYVTGATVYGWLAFWNGTGPISNIYVQNNDIYGNVNNNAIYYYGGKTVTNLVQSNNLSQSPVFVGGTPYDFHLQSNSPLIERGLDVDLVMDYDSVAVPIGTLPDIGVYEYGVPSPAINPTVVSTRQPSWTSETTATSGGYVTDDGGGTVTARGICWNTAGSPTTADSHTSNGSGTGAFTAFLTGLTYSELYYVRAYATNEAGTSYGAQLTFRSSQWIRHKEKILMYNGKLIKIE